MTTYYIDYKNGNDTTGDGSSGAPYKTLAKALTVAGNNDTVKARGDSADKTTWFREYNHTISETPFTLQNDTGHTPVFVPTHEYTTWNKTGGLTNVYEAAYTSASCWGVWNGTTLLTSVASTAACDGATNSRYFDNAGDKLYVNIGGGAPTSIEAYDVGNAYAMTASGANVTISGIAYWYQMQALRFTGATGVISGCDFKYNSGYSAAAEFGYVFINASGATVSACTFSAGVANKTYGIGTGSSGASMTVTGCTLTGPGYSGIYITHGTGHVVTLSTASAYTVDGLNAIGASGGVVSYFTAYDCAHGGIRTGETGGTSDWITHHCTVYKTSGTMSFGYICDGGAADFYHCVAEAVGRGFIIQTNGEVNAENNIVLDCTASGYYVNAANNPTGTRDYNCAHDNVNDYEGNWTAAAHDIDADPAFIDEAGHDYRLTGDSPCIDVGVAVAGINDGYSGTAPDMGRFEYTIQFLAALLTGTGALAGTVARTTFGAATLTGTGLLTGTGTMQSFVVSATRTLTVPARPTFTVPARPSFVVTE